MMGIGDIFYGRTKGETNKVIITKKREKRKKEKALGGPGYARRRDTGRNLVFPHCRPSFSSRSLPRCRSACPLDYFFPYARPSTPVAQLIPFMTFFFWS